MPHITIRASEAESAHVADAAARRGLTVASYLRERLGLPLQRPGQRNDLTPPPAPKRPRKAVAR